MYTKVVFDIADFTFNFHEKKTIKKAAGSLCL